MYRETPKSSMSSMKRKDFEHEIKLVSFENLYSSAALTWLDTLVIALNTPRLTYST